MDFIELEPHKFSHIFVTIFIIYISEFIKSRLANDKRQKIAQIEREDYHRNLQSQSIKMEEEELNLKIEQAKEIQLLQEEEDEKRIGIEPQLGDDQDDEEGWSSESSILDEQLRSLEAKEDELISAQTQLQKVSHELTRNLAIQQDATLQSAMEETKQLKERIELLMEENSNLSEQIETLSHNRPEIKSMKINESTLDEKLVEFLELHKDEFTLDSLNNIYQTILGLRASEPDLDLNGFVRAFKSSRNKVKELSDLHLIEKSATIKYNKLRDEYMTKLTIDGLKINKIIENSSAKEKLQALTMKIQKLEDCLQEYEEQAEFKQRKIDELKDQLEKAEENYKNYRRAQRDAEEKYQSLKAREDDMHLNMSDVSSLHHSGGIPSPPPCHPPTAEEIQKMLNRPNCSSIDHDFDNSAISDIPPPPPVSVPSFKMP